LAKTPPAQLRILSALFAHTFFAVFGKFTDDFVGYIELLFEKLGSRQSPGGLEHCPRATPTGILFRCGYRRI